MWQATLQRISQDIPSMVTFLAASDEVEAPFTWAISERRTLWRYWSVNASMVTWRRGYKFASEFVVKISFLPSLKLVKGGAWEKFFTYVSIDWSAVTQPGMKLLFRLSHYTCNPGKPRQITDTCWNGQSSNPSTAILKWNRELWRRIRLRPINGGRDSEVGTVTFLRAGQQSNHV